jgi:hypothetical protein
LAECNFHYHWLLTALRADAMARPGAFVRDAKGELTLSLETAIAA